MNADRAKAKVMEVIGCLFIVVLILWGALAIAAWVIDERNRRNVFKGKG